MSSIPPAFPAAGTGSDPGPQGGRRPSPQVRIALLGPVRAWRAATELSLGSAQRRAVLAHLAMRADHPVPRDDLVDALWGEHPPPSAASTVHTHIWALRRALEPGRDPWSKGGILTSRNSGYRLHVGERDVDVLRFEALCGQARRHRSAGDPWAELDAVQAAIALWRGGALAGAAGPLADVQRLRLEELRIAVVERRATLLIQLGSGAEVVGELRELTARFPLRESLHALLMTALSRDGRQAEALAVYRGFHHRLVAEAGLEPTAALRRLHDAVLGRT